MKKMKTSVDVKSKEEMKKIFQKSLKLLDRTEQDLNEIKKALKKTVNRLAAVAKGDDRHINTMLAKIKTSVADHVDLIALDKGLDELFSVLNRHQDTGISTVGEVSTEKAASCDIYESLKQGVNQYNFSSLSIAYKRKIQQLLDDTRSDTELVEGVLDLVNELGIELNDALVSVDKSSQQLYTFEHTIRQSLFNADSGEQKKSTQNILDVLAKDITRYVSDIRKENRPDVFQKKGKDAITHIAPTGRIVAVVSALIEILDIPELDKNKKQAMIQALPSADEGCDAWIENIRKIAELVNTNISVLQNDKKDLSNFILTITRQLADIEKYVEQSRLQNKDSATQSAILRSSLDDSVGKIQHKVRAADDISKLKRDVQEQIDTIKENVESYKHYEEEAERIAKKQYEKMIGELAQSRKQTEKLKQQLENSRTQLLRDELTGLPNRVAYNERILIEVNRWKRNKEALCIAMWDIDNFKNINDTFGHDAGDRVLKLFARIIVDRVRRTDLFARMGGEEFILVMPDTSVDTALQLNNKLRKALQRYQFQYNEDVVPVTASIGIAEFSEGLTEEEVLKRADKALYTSKNKGRNQCSVFSDKKNN